MTSSATPISQPNVLADLLPAGVLPRAWVRTAALVIGGALLVALASQVKIPLGFTPVPINGLTFATLIVGGALGARRGVAALSLFWILGVIGLPFFQSGNSGWTYATGATGGYLIGSVLAAMVVGAVAERGGDRRVLTSVTTMLAVNVVLIWGLGTLWLSHVLGVPVFGGAKSGFAMGIQPFIAGDIFKVVLAGLLLPATWSGIKRWS
ncbi:MAG TPA: biotin transporter BioY [Microthrixaceae bacterium]|nr:biotin transporter BioY [Microthrixaceae bacterium]